MHGRECYICGRDANIKHEAKPNALLASRQRAECFILHIARARPCFNCSKELTHERLVKAYPFQVAILAILVRKLLSIIEFGMPYNLWI